MCMHNDSLRGWPPLRQDLVLVLPFPDQDFMYKQQIISFSSLVYYM